MSRAAAVRDALLVLMHGECWLEATGSSYSWQAVFAEHAGGGLMVPLGHRSCLMCPANIVCMMSLCLAASSLELWGV